jgi:hypothetical protein
MVTVAATTGVAGVAVPKGVGRAVGDDRGVVKIFGVGVGGLSNSGGSVGSIN